MDELSDGIGPAGQQIPWNPDGWTGVGASTFPKTSATLDFLTEASTPNGHGLPSLSRQAVRDAHDKLGVHGGFLAALVWGFGPTGYGASRVAKILAFKDAAATAADIWAIAAERGAQEGFSSLWHNGRSRIRGLGTAFGTKILYFAATAATPGPTPLILDQFVFKGAQRLAGGDVIGDATRVPDPRKYLTGVRYADYCAWADEQAPGAGDAVEYVLFQQGQR